MHPVLDLSSAAESSPESSSERPALRERARLQAARCWTVVKITFSICMRYRITGLAAEAAFFALLSLPPLAIGLAGTLGYLNGWIGAAHITQVKNHILHGAGTMLSGPGVAKLDGLLNSLLSNGHPDLISIGFLLAVWAGSRAMNVYVDTITIAYGLSGMRGIVRTRLLAFGMYFLGLILGSVALPLLVLGPDMLISVFPGIGGVIHAMYWPLMLTAMVAFLNTLYHLAVPERTPWSQDLPGTILAILLWLGGSALLRDYVSSTFSGKSSSDSLYGGLAAAVAILVWLYVTALATLLGAALNAAVEQVWPSRKLWLARLVMSQRVAAQRSFRAEGAGPRRKPRRSDGPAPEDRPAPPAGTPAGPGRTGRPARQWAPRGPRGRRPTWAENYGDNSQPRSYHEAIFPGNRWIPDRVASRIGRAEPDENSESWDSIRVTSSSDGLAAPPRARLGRRPHQSVRPAPGGSRRRPHTRPRDRGR